MSLNVAHEKLLCPEQMNTICPKLKYQSRKYEKQTVDKCLLDISSGNTGQAGNRYAIYFQTLISVADRAAAWRALLQLT